MKFYIDTNVLADFCLRREPHFSASMQILNFAFTQKIELFTSTHCIATLHYICKRNFAEAELRKIITQFLEYLSILPVTEDVLKKSLKSQHKDFEDAIQIFCAHQIISLDGIITRNRKDFLTAEIRIFAPDEAINYIKKIS